jgi:ABC-type dipeptide/oligopeptide/nickel transport system permease component
MKTYVVSRLLTLIPLLAGVSILTFVMLRIGYGRRACRVCRHARARRGVAP